MAAEQDSNKAIILKMYEEVWNKGNYDYIETAVSPDFVDHPPKRFFTVVDRGREALYEAATVFRSGFPDFHDEMIQIVAEGDRVVYLGRISGTHTGKYFQFAPTGSKVDIMGINDFRMQSGVVVERWGIFDTLGMMRQMGIIPAAPGAH
jgi:predicted ester cyclase